MIHHRRHNEPKPCLTELNTFPLVYFIINGLIAKLFVEHAEEDSAKRRGREKESFEYFWIFPHRPSNAKTCTVMILGLNGFECEVSVRMLYDMYRSALPRGDINIGSSAEQPPRNVRQI